ncbi:conserved hypothetical integral membrane protein [Amphibacillus marinus]|uniref:Conserved hypothetical integral membrane protein n=1 Tax=Amphibacillus marinus TaxID=872970 RepID=A0A1H8N2E7_9BACI|nr:DUF1146 family protein [Amphibacillus marinus]SEO23732.1 conserved hypothetical integral membrane protein [Amphibacillus marinus]
MLQDLGIEALINIVSHLFFITVTWQVIRAVRLDEIFSKNRILEARIFILFVTIMIGSAVSNFVIDLLTWSQRLLYLF